jgi:L-ribulose-5-phosphate 3-epimerase
VKTAVNQWCFPDGTSIDEVFAVCRRAGLDGVELNLNPPGGVGLTLDTNAAEARAIARLAAAHGLELKSLSTALLWDVPLSSPDAATRARGKAVVRKQLELAAELEMDAILVVPGVVTPEVSYEECWARSQEALAELASEAEKLGVRIGVENVWNRFLLSPLEMVRYLDEIGSPWVGAYFDVGNVLLFGYPEQWIRSLGGRIVKVHVKDFSLRAGNAAGFVPLLAGDVDWPAVRQALSEVGYDDYLTAELAPYGSYAEQLIFDTARHLQKIIGGDANAGMLA